MIKRIRTWAKKLKEETLAVYFAYQDPRVPWYARLLAFFVVAHTFSPIDLIPDFIPVLGFLDDLIITPLGLALAVKLIPADVMAEARIKSAETLVDGTSLSRAGLIIVISLWLAGLLLVSYFLAQIIWN
jgi:uncharacterized membrane protein YkvA (DUF1232 family)